MVFQTIGLLTSRWHLLLPQPFGWNSSGEGVLSRVYIFFKSHGICKEILSSSASIFHPHRVYELSRISDFYFINSIMFLFLILFMYTSFSTLYCNCILCKSEHVPLCCDIVVANLYLKLKEWFFYIVQKCGTICMYIASIINTLL